MAGTAIKRYWQDRGWRLGARISLTVFIVFMLLTMISPALSDSTWWPLQVILDILAIGGAALFILPRRMTLFTAAAGMLLVFGALAAYESTQLTGYYDVALGRFKEEWSIAGHAYKADIRMGNMASHYTEITGKPLPEPEWRMTWMHSAGAIADGPSSMVRDFEKVWESMKEASRRWTSRSASWKQPPKLQRFKKALSRGRVHMRNGFTLKSSNNIWARLMQAGGPSCHSPTQRRSWRSGGRRRGNDEVLLAGQEVGQDGRSWGYRCSRLSVLHVEPYSLAGIGIFVLMKAAIAIAEVVLFWYPGRKTIDAEEKESKGEQPPKFYWREIGLRLVARWLLLSLPSTLHLGLLRYSSITMARTIHSSASQFSRRCALGWVGG